MKHIRETTILTTDHKFMNKGGLNLLDNWSFMANMINFWSSEVQYPDFSTHFKIKSRASCKSFIFY
jgi:hypothetical protein